MPTVSVLMPVYNVAPYVAEAMRSVLSQTFSDVELIVVDDGSRDESLAIAKAIAAEDARVVVLTQANSGVSAARNAAIGVAQGSIFALLDSDDLWEPGYLGAQLAVFATDPAIDVVSGNGRFLGGPRDGQPVRPPELGSAPTLADIITNERSIFIMSLFRRRVFERIGGFDPSLRTNEDYDFWIRAAEAGFVFRCNPDPLGRYRCREDSLSFGEVRMVRGILRVYRKHRLELVERFGMAGLVDEQIVRLERELAAAETREALITGDYAALPDRLERLYACRPTRATRLARAVGRRSPRTLSAIYRLVRRHSLAAATAS